MKIALIGSGKVGGALGERWSAASHDLVFGVREPERKRAERAPENPDIPFDTISGAIARSEVVVFAIPGKAMDAVIGEHAGGLAGKLIIDATNDFEGPSLSHVEAINAAVEGAHVFRAFNSLGWENFSHPAFGSEIADLFYCGSDAAEPQQTLEGLVGDVGLRPIRVGGLDQLSIVDSIVRLWFTLAVGRKFGRHMAFKMLTD